MSALKKESFAIYEAISKRITPLGRATLEEAKDTYRSLRNCHPHAGFYLVRLDMIDEVMQ